MAYPPHPVIRPGAAQKVTIGASHNASALVMIVRNALRQLGSPRPIRRDSGDLHHAGG